MELSGVETIGDAEEEAIGGKEAPKADETIPDEFDLESDLLEFGLLLFIGLRSAWTAK